MDYNKFNNSIIICDDETKKHIIKNSHFLNVKFKSFAEASIDILGSYDDLVYEISKEKMVNPYIAKMIYDSFLISKRGISDKLDMICDIKDKYNNRYNYIKPINYTKVFVINYYYNDNIFNYALSKINYEMLYIKDKNNKKTTLYRANTRYDEVFYVFNRIAALLEKNETDIYIIAPSDYNVILKEYSQDFNIDIDINANISLFSLPETNSFLNESNGIVKDDISNLILKNELYSPIIDKLNLLRINNEKTSDAREYLEYLFKNTNIILEKYRNAIKVTNSIPINSKHVFILGLNQGIVPSIYQDVNYLSDYEFKMLNLKTSLDMNIYEKKRLKNLIDNTEYVYLSNYKSYEGKKKEESLFLNLIEYEEDKFEFDTIYSKKALNKLAAIMLDNYYKYGDKHSLLGKIYNTTCLKYNSYSNDYKGKIKYNLNSLSYSKLDTYIKCPFQFYLKYVLNLKTKENKNAKIGEYFHKLLELCKTPDDVKKVSAAVSDNYFDMSKNKNKFIVNNYNIIIEELIKNYNSFKEKTKYKEELREYEVNIYLDGINFSGKIDLLLKNGMDVVLIDYKTSSIKSNLNELEYGINMQLPIYMMFAKKLGYSINGAFIKNVKHNLVKDKDFYIEFKKNSRFDGYYIDDYKCLNDFYSDTYDNVIKGCKTKTNGDFDSNSKKRALKRSEIENVIDITIKKIEENIKRINEGKFNVNPYQIINDNGDDKSDSCKYCQFMDICYKREKNYRKIELNTNLEVIGRGEQ